MDSTQNISIYDPYNKTSLPIGYQPDASGRVILGVNYLGYSFSVNSVISYSSGPHETTSIGGSSQKGTDYQFRIFGEKNTFDFFYENHKGFQIGNTKQIDPTYNATDPLIHNPDLQSVHFGVQYFRTLQPENYSLAANFNQSGWQKESGGSFFLFGGLDFHRIQTTTFLIPSQLAATYSSIQNFKSGEFETIKLGVGGAYSFVFRNLFLSLFYTYSGGQQNQKIDLGSDGSPKQRQLPTYGQNSKWSLGYNGDNFFLAMNFFQDLTAINLIDKMIDMTTNEYQLILGVHF